jgi:hypothetical protein
VSKPYLAVGFRKDLLAAKFDMECKDLNICMLHLLLVINTEQTRDDKVHSNEEFK